MSINIADLKHLKNSFVQKWEVVVISILSIVSVNKISLFKYSCMYAVYVYILYCIEEVQY